MAEQIDLGTNATRTVIRSTFRPDKPFEHSFTCNTGDVVPAFMTINVLPHDTWKFKVNTMVKMQTPLHPTIGRAYQMWVAYYNPHRNIWKNWDAFMGEVKDAAWVSQTSYFTPKINIVSTIKSGTFLDHIGWRIGDSLIGATNLTSLKLRHYLQIANEWLRDPNYEAPIYTNDPSVSVTYDGVTLTGAELWGDTAISNGDTLFGGGKLYKINRKAEYFSVVLPEPYRAPTALTMPVGRAAPVFADSSSNTYTYAKTPVRVKRTDDGTFSSAVDIVGAGGSGVGNEYRNLAAQTLASGQTDIGTLYFSNLKADLVQATGIPLNEFRSFIRKQQIYELDARAGQRMAEQLYGRWGIEVDELELGKPRMLCCDQGMINITQVPQTSETVATSPQGNLAAFGQGELHGDWNTHSFKYNGCLAILFWIRTEHKYQYGVPREDMQNDRFDFWHPEFDGEGDQQTYMAEIWALAANVNNPASSTWGYNEQGAHLKSFPSIITGELRSDAATVYNIDGTVHGTLDSWTYADKYATQPTASASWMKETPENVDRTIHVQSSKADQWLVDFAMELELTRAMHAHNIPGIDRV